MYNDTSAWPHLSRPLNLLPQLQTIFLPVVGLVDPDKLKPGDLVGVNKDSYLILDTLPSEYDSRVKAMEVDEKPTEDYNDSGGLEKQVDFDSKAWSIGATLLLFLLDDHPASLSIPGQFFIYLFQMMNLFMVRVFLYDAKNKIKKNILMCF